MKWHACPTMWGLNDFSVSYINLLFRSKIKHDHYGQLPATWVWKCRISSLNVRIFTSLADVTVLMFMVCNQLASRYWSYFLLGKPVKGPLILHYSDAIMGAMASQIASLTIVYLTVYSDQRKHQSSTASQAFVRGIHRWLANSPHKWPVTRKMFPFDDVIMWNVPPGYLS